MDVARRVAKNTGFLYARIVVNIIIALYSTRLILDALGVEDFGIYSLIGGAIALFGFLNSAMAEATQRFMSFAQGEGNFNNQNSIFNVSVVLHLIIAFIVVLLLEVAGYFLFNGILEIPEERMDVAKLVYQFMIVSTFFTILKVPYDAVLTAHENMFLIAVLGIVHAFLKLGIAIYITYTTFDQLIVYGLLMVVLSVFIIIILYIYCHINYEEVRFNLTKQFDKNLFKEMGSFASWSLLSQAAFIITMQGTSIVLNLFFGVVVNAAQGVSNQVSNQLKGFSNTMLKALNPVIVKKEGEKNREKMLQASMFGNKIAFFVLSFFTVPLLLEMPFVLNLWLKNVPEYAVVFCRLSLISMSIGLLTETFYVAIGAIGKIKQSAIWDSLIFTSVLPVSFLMYKFGASPEAIYINLILMAVGISVARVFFLNRLGGLSVKIFLNNVVARCLGVFILTFLLTSVPSLTITDSIWKLLIVLFTSSISFPIFVYFLGLNKIEKKQIQDVLLSFMDKGFRSFRN